MQQVLVNTPPTISETWYEDGVAADPGSVTVTITRADGSVLVSRATASGIGAGPRSFALTTVHTAQLDRLTVQWVSPTLGTLTSVVEIVGGFYFPVADALAISELAEETPAAIASARALAEQSFEEATGVAFVPRYARVKVSATLDSLLPLPFLPVRSVRDVSMANYPGGAALTISTALVRPTPTGLYYQAGWGYYGGGIGSGWIPGARNITVGYEYGRDEPPARVSRAVLLLAKTWLTKGPIDDRATSIAVDGGSISLMTPGLKGVTFGIPEVDATVEAYKVKRSIATLRTTPASNEFGLWPDLIA